MMRRSDSLIGDALANADDATQAEVFNEFVRTLDAFCKVAKTNVGFQAYCIARFLNVNTVEFFREMVQAYDHGRQGVQDDLIDLERQRNALLETITRLNKEADEREPV